MTSKVISDLDNERNVMNPNDYIAVDSSVDAKTYKMKLGKIVNKAATYIIEEPLNIWTIDHNLGYYPEVVVMDMFNRIILVEVEYSSLNQIRVYLSSPQIGKVLIK